VEKQYFRSRFDPTQIGHMKNTLWIGTVELKPMNPMSHEWAGAFTNVITWASNAMEFRQKTDVLASSIGYFVAGVEQVEPYSTRIKHASVSEEIQKLAIDAESNSNAILLATFHTYPFDQA
jgi:hypothetical protein